MITPCTQVAVVSVMEVSLRLPWKGMWRISTLVYKNI